MKKIIYLAFLTKFVLLPTDVTGTITQRPLNAATSVNGEVSFNCSSNSAAITSWVFTIKCNALVGDTLTAGNCDFNSSYAAHYRTENSTDGFVCNLIVFDAVLSLGGCYACSDGSGSGHNYEAMLIVVDTNANMTSNATDIVAGDDVTISSSVSYRGPSIPQQPPPLPPQFYWTSQSDKTQNITSYQGLTTNTSASSYIIVKANPPDFGPYACNLFFNPPTSVPLTCADNNPIYSKSWNSSTQPVSYPPENLAISVTPNACLDEAAELICSASGHPMPTYKWFNLTNGTVLSDSNTITIDRSGSYECVASNIIRNVLYNASTSVYVSDCVELGISDAACISLLVIVPYFGLNLLFFTIFMSCYGCSESGRNKLNDKFDWLKKMLPCMKDKGCQSIKQASNQKDPGTAVKRSQQPPLGSQTAKTGCKCSVWILYFVLLSIFAAFVFFPTILIMASCCEKKEKGSQVAPS